MERLRKRRDFLAASRAPWKARRTVVVQCRERGDDDPPRVGFTASKKVGNAVRRNRAKRRLRALAHEHLAPRARPGHDYVLVARPDTPAADWAALVDDFQKALLTLHA